eukprot:1685215-Pyramimonas_sp.AAC.2
MVTTIVMMTECDDGDEDDYYDDADDGGGDDNDVDDIGDDTPRLVRPGIALASGEAVRGVSWGCLGAVLGYLWVFLGRIGRSPHRIYCNTG